MFLGVQQSLVSKNSVNEPHFKNRKHDQELLGWAVNNERRRAFSLEEHQMTEYFNLYTVAHLMVCLEVVLYSDSSELVHYVML